MVVGFAMGFAVIPTIFSIAEDAIFTVPKQLTYGSLALGATPWQSLQRVVLPTASPGIFSALMIGMGRAVGETMIVLDGYGKHANHGYQYIRRHAYTGGKYRRRDSGVRSR